MLYSVISRSMDMKSVLYDVRWYPVNLRRHRLGWPQIFERQLFRDIYANSDFWCNAPVDFFEAYAHTGHIRKRLESRRFAPLNGRGTYHLRITRRYVST